MKTLKTIMPIVAIPLSAIFFAFQSNSPKDEILLTNVQGYLRIRPAQCVPSSLCSQTGGQICTVNDVPGGAQLFGKSVTGDCVIPLYRPVPK